MGIFRKKQQPFDSVGVAQALLSNFVEISDEKSDHLLGPNLAIPPEMKSRFHSKAHLYRLAIVLAVLINNEQKHPGVLEVRKSLEKLVFTMPQEDSIAFIEELREAAGSLHNLLYSENKNKDGVWTQIPI